MLHSRRRGTPEVIAACRSPPRLPEGGESEWAGGGGGGRGATGEAELTGVAAPVAHVCRNEAPLVCGRVVELHGRQVAGAVVAADHVQQPVDGAHAWGRSTAVSATASEEDASERLRRPRRPV